MNEPFEEGLKTERKLFGELMSGSQSAAQRYAFFAERQADKIPDVPDDTAVIPVNKVGIIGAGTMGGGIAMNFMNAGIPVTIVEVKQDALDRGLATIRRNYERSRTAVPAETEARMSRLTGSLDLSRAGRLRPRHRGRVRADGHQEGRVHQARRDLQAAARSWPPTPRG